MFKLNNLIYKRRQLTHIGCRPVTEVNGIHNRYFYLYKFQQLRWESLYGL